jgi:enolase
MKIQDISVNIVFDSRACATIEAVVFDTEGNKFTGIVPAGKSTGVNEAHILDPHDARRVITETVSPAFNDKEVRSIAEIDSILLGLDGTGRKEQIGGNVMLGVSIAMVRALAFAQKKEPWEVIRAEFFSNETELRSPYIFSNLINGGAHAANNLSIQEYMVIADTKEEGVLRSIERLIAFYKELGEDIKRMYSLPRITIGDESGYAVDFDDNFAPIALLEKKIVTSEMQRAYRIALDAAASGFYKDGAYSFDGNMIDEGALKKIYDTYFDRSELLYSIEDPFEETKEDAFRSLQVSHADRVIVGDDLTTTNTATIERSAKNGAITGVIIKPNQIGTVTESCEAIRRAHELGVRTIVSHRSGETEDPILVQIAAAANAYGVKIGAPLRERVFKFNELLRIYS